MSSGMPHTEHHGIMYNSIPISEFRIPEGRLQVHCALWSEIMHGKTMKHTLQIMIWGANCVPCCNEMEAQSELDFSEYHLCDSMKHAVTFFECICYEFWSKPNKVGVYGYSRFGNFCWACSKIPCGNCTQKMLWRTQLDHKDDTLKIPARSELPFHCNRVHNLHLWPWSNVPLQCVFHGFPVNYPKLKYTVHS